jgi:hypothetical protein
LKIIHAFVVYATSIVLALLLATFFSLKADQLETNVTNLYFLNTYNFTMAEASHLLEHTAEPLSKVDYKGPLAVCEEQLVMQVPAMYSLMIFIWFATMVSEFRLIVNWFSHLWFMPIVSEPEASQHELVDASDSKVERRYDLIQEDANGKRHSITKITRTLKVLLIVLHPIVRLTILLIVGYAGAKFLILQTDEIGVLLKALCMKFVVDLDDVVFKGFSTAKIRKEVATFKMVYRRDELDGMDRGENTWWNSGLGAFLYQSLAVGLVLVLQFIVFSNLSGFRLACRRYNDRFPKELDAPPTKDILQAFYHHILNEA